MIFFNHDEEIRTAVEAQKSPPVIDMARLAVECCEQRNKMAAVLEDVLEYLDGFKDADCDEYGAFHGNRAMTLCMEIERALGRRGEHE